MARKPILRRVKRKPVKVNRVKQKKPLVRLSDDKPLVVELLRPDDFLVLKFSFKNLTLHGDVLRRSDTNHPALIVVQFPPLAIAEELYDRSAPAPPPPIKGYLSSDSYSQIVLRVPENIKKIHFSEKGLLEALNKFPIVGARPTSEPVGVFSPSIPDPKDLNITALEIPYRLIISPMENSGCSHRVEPFGNNVGENGLCFELWHTTLQPPDNQELSVRAIWTQDMGKSGSVVSNKLSLKPKERMDIVNLSNGFGILFKQQQPVEPKPISVDKLKLTSLGGLLEAAGAWDAGIKAEGEAINLVGWSSHSNLGREHFSVVTTSGVLLPTGHRANLMQIRKRTIERNYAVLELIATHLLLSEQSVTYEPTHLQHNGRDWPFTSVKFTKKQFLNIHATPSSVNTDAWSCEIDEYGNGEFEATGVGLTGQLCKLNFSWLCFIQDSLSNLPGIEDVYNKSTTKRPPETLREIRMQDQHITYVEGEGPNKAFTTESLILSCRPVTSDKSSVLFAPFISKAVIEPPAILLQSGNSKEESLSSRALHTTRNNPTIEYYKPFLDQGDSLPGGVFASLLDSTIKVISDADRLGGLVNFNTSITGFSHKLGPVSGLLYKPSSVLPDNIANGIFDPTEYFPLDGKLLGAIALTDIIQQATMMASPKSIPKFETSLHEGVVSESTFDWNPMLNNTTLLKFDDPSNALSLHVSILTKGDKVSRVVEGTLKSFRLILPYITVNFGHVKFTSESGSKTKFEVGIDSLDFTDSLQFLNNLKNQLSFDSFGSRLAINVKPRAVEASLSLGIPDFSIGLFGITHARFTSQLNLPFDNSPLSLDLGVAEQHKPFLVSFFPLGGGGFFSLRCGSSGIIGMRATLEFGGIVGLDFGVASGSLYAMAGIYYAYVDGDTIQLQAYFRCGGELNVLEIINVSTEFYMYLQYDFQTGNLAGDATLTIKVDVLFFSEEVSIGMHKEFSGSNLTLRSSRSKKTGAKLLSASDDNGFLEFGNWNEYVHAFGVHL